MWVSNEKSQVRPLGFIIWHSTSEWQRTCCKFFYKLVHVLRGKEGSSQLQANRDVSLDGVTFSWLDWLQQGWTVMSCLNGGLHFQDFGGEKFWFVGI